MSPVRLAIVGILAVALAACASVESSPAAGGFESDDAPIKGPGAPLTEEELDAQETALWLEIEEVRLADARKLVLLCPDEHFVAGLPQGKIPDRSDFTRMREDARIAYWQACVDAAEAMAAEFVALVEGPDPLAGVTVHA